MKIEVPDFENEYMEDETEIFDLSVNINGDTCIAIGYVSFSTNKKEMELEDIMHIKDMDECPLCKQQAIEEEECPFANQDYLFQQELLDILCDEYTQTAPLEGVFASLAGLSFSLPVFYPFHFVDKYFRSYWAVKGEIDVFFNGQTYKGNLVASLDEGEDIEFDRVSFPHINNYYLYASYQKWRVFENPECFELESIPRISDSALQQLKNDIALAITPYFTQFEQEIMKKEAKHEIPLISDITIVQKPYHQFNYECTFRLKGNTNVYSLSLGFSLSDYDSLWDASPVKKNGNYFTIPCSSYYQHLFEQCKKLAMKHDQNWRIKLTLGSHEAHHDFALFQPISYPLSDVSVIFK